MEPFKITCVTCQAKLSVRSAALLGQIVACPRCGSMVEVALPSVTAASDAAAVEAPLAVNSPFVESAATQFEPPASLETEQGGVAEQNTVADATDPAQLAHAEVGRYQLMVWSIASFTIGGALVAGLLLTRNTTPHNAGESAHETFAQNSLDTKQPSPGLTTSAPVATAPALPSVQPDVEPTAQTQSEELTPAPTSETTNAEVALTESDSSHTPEPLTSESPKPEEPVPAEPAANERIARRFDPLDFDPEELTLSAVELPEVQAETSEPELTAPGESAIEEEPPAEPSTVPLVRRGPDQEKDAIERDAARQLALKFPAMKFDDLPLQDCLRLFSQLGGVPISIAPEHLLMAGITSQRRVSLDVAERNLGEMLQQLLEPLRLEFETRGNQVVLMRQDSMKVRKINYPVDDLVETGTSEEQLAEWIQQLIVPESWQSAGGKGIVTIGPDSLQLTNAQAVQYQVLILLERLRLARDLPPKSRYPVQRLAGTTVNLVHKDRLAQATTFTFTQFTPIADVIAYWQTELGVPMLVDWPALGDADVQPTTTITCSIVDQPWGVALEKVLEPLGLGWRAVTGSAIEITSAEKVSNELQLEVYALQSLSNGALEQLIEKINALVNQNAGRQATAIAYDPQGNALLILHSGELQRKVSQLLDQQHLLLDE